MLPQHHRDQQRTQTATLWRNKLKFKAVHFSVTAEVRLLLSMQPAEATSAAYLLQREMQTTDRSFK